MKRKIILSIFSIVLLLALAACSKYEVPGDEAEEADEEEGSDLAFDRYEVGDEITTEHGNFTLEQIVKEDREVEEEPVKVRVDFLAAASGNVADKFVEIVGGEELHYIRASVEAENISDDLISFDMAGAKMITDTGEEIEHSDMLMSDFVQEEIYPGVKLNGSFIWVLEESKAEEIDSVTFIWEAPVNDADETLGEDVEIEIQF